ncbi:MAG: hypothetical protein ACRDQW_17455 [Haloechinothrix sp.]
MTAYPGNLRAREACFGYRELRSLSDVLVDELYRGRPVIPAGRHVSGIGTDVSSMRVAVELSDYTRRREEAIERRYGPAVCVPRRSVIYGPNKVATTRRIGLASAENARLCAGGQS